MSKSRILSFLNRAVPGGKERFQAWRKAAALLGPLAPEICIDMLKMGRAPYHYAALLVLREYGYEAYAHGFWAETTYSVAKPGTLTINIIPAQTDLGWEPPEPTVKKRKSARKPARPAKPLRSARSTHRV